MALSSGIQKYRQASSTSKSQRSASSKAKEAKEAKDSHKENKEKEKKKTKSEITASSKTTSKTTKQTPASQESKQEAKQETKPEVKSEVKPEGKKDATQPSAVEVLAVELIQELEVELQLGEKLEEKDKKLTSKLVRDDFTPANTTRDHLIIEYAPLIKYIAQKIAARLPANIELDDLISSGVIGLMDAIDKYDASRDNKFKTYAEFRIRGAILDELRAQDWVPRSVREKAKQLERCYAHLEQEKGRQATDEEVCEALGITQEEYFGMLNQVRSVSLLSFDDLGNFSKADKRSIHSLGGNSSRVPTPFNEVNIASLKQLISRAIHDLPEKQRLVLSLYYYEDLNLKEIGKVLDVTESRVSQLHTQAILRLKGKLRNHWDDFVSLIS